MNWDRQYPIDFETMDALVNQCLPGFAPGFVGFAREVLTTGSVIYRLSNADLGAVGTVTLLRLGDRVTEMQIREADNLAANAIAHQGKVTQALFARMSEYLRQVSYKKPTRATGPKPDTMKKYKRIWVYLKKRSKIADQEDVHLTQRELAELISEYDRDLTVGVRTLRDVLKMGREGKLD